MKTIIPFKAQAEKSIAIYSGYFTLFLVQGLFLMIFFLSEKIIGNIIGLTAFCLLAIWMKRIIRTVHFKEKNIQIKYLYGDFETVEYSDLKKFYENSIPSAEEFVYIIKYRADGRKKLKKLTFYQADFDFDAFKHELIVKKKNGFEKSSVSQ